MAKGRIHSIESMGLVDGPGIRAVVFFQGCKLRCEFCHNPESWNLNGGEEVDSSEISKKLIGLKPYFDKSGGGVTFSGGEPLLQKDFLIALLKDMKNAGIHTCLDTSGVGCGDYDEILSLTDLVLYDVKAIESDKYKSLCKRDIKETENFQKALAKYGVPVIVRQVVIPGYNDTDEYMLSLKDYINKNIPYAKSVELLPFHLLGAHKYKKMGIFYPLGELSPMDKEKTEKLSKKYFQNI